VVMVICLPVKMADMRGVLHYGQRVGLSRLDWGCATAGKC